MKTVAIAVWQGKRGWIAAGKAVVEEWVVGEPAMAPLASRKPVVEERVARRDAMAAPVDRPALHHRHRRKSVRFMLAACGPGPCVGCMDGFRSCYG